MLVSRLLTKYRPYEVRLSTLNRKNLIDPNFITGLIDGEGPAYEVWDDARTSLSLSFPSVPSSYLAGAPYFVRDVLVFLLVEREPYFVWGL